MSEERIDYEIHSIMERRKAGNQISLLEKYGYTEQMAFDLCKKYDLLSPIYDFTLRGGAVGFALMLDTQN